jgi:tight adherence protein C
MILAQALVVASVLLGAAAFRCRRDARVAALVEGLSSWPGTADRPARRLVAVAASHVPNMLLRPRPRMRRLLVLAGLDWSPAEVAFVKHSMALGSALAALLAAGFGPALFLLPLIVAAAYRAPDIALARRARSRQSDIERRVPDLVELLVAITEAGLAPGMAFRRSAEVLVGALGAEVRLAVDEIDLGLPWRTAMERLVERTDVPSLRRLVSTLARSNRLGTPIRSTLRSVADDLRADRRAKAEEAARRAPVKMLFPLVFLILPAFLLLTVGPVVLATVHSLRSG